MIVCYTRFELEKALSAIRTSGRTIGFIPTMGALHEGHISLFQSSDNQGDAVVGSIFVNPTQFNEQSDYDLYPRTLDADIALLKEKTTCEVLFAPTHPKEVYSGAFTPSGVDLGNLAHVMEGKHRPGHFEGVVEVVSRLFNLFQPDKAYFGEKDFQQLAVIRHMTQEMGLPIEIIGCPTSREPNGLAMSSRNERLSAAARDKAGVIFQALSSIRDNQLAYSLETCVNQARDTIDREGGFAIEYLEVADGHSLQPIAEWHDSAQPVVCSAIHIEGVRLIDNLRLESLLRAN